MNCKNCGIEIIKVKTYTGNYHYRHKYKHKPELLIDNELIINDNKESNNCEHLFDIDSWWDKHKKFVYIRCECRYCGLVIEKHVNILNQEIKDLKESGGVKNE